MTFKTASLVLLLASLAAAQNWQPEVSLGSNASAFEIIPIDANGDAHEDVILIGNDVLLALNNGNGTFAGATAIITTQVSARDCDVADFDGDGNQDIVYCSRSRVGIQVGDGSGGFATQLILEMSTDSFFSDVAVGDLEGDGDLDVVILSVKAGFIGYYENIGTPVAPSFAPRVDVHLMPTGANHHFGGLELHSEGGANPDIVFASPVDDRAGLIPNNGGLSFGAVQGFVSGNAPRDIALADIDGDGDKDVVVGGDDLQWIEYITNVGFVFVNTVTYGSAIATLDTGDIDNDGSEDLVVNGANQVAWLANHGGGTFAAAASIAATVSNSRGVLAHDFTGNGSADVIATGFNSQDFNLVLNRPEYAGTEGDFVLLSGVNDAADNIAMKSAGLGDVLSIEVRSPMGSMVGEPNTVIVGQVFPTGQQLAGPFPGIDLDLSLPAFLVFDSTVNGPLGPVSVPLPADGFELTATLPAGFAGSSVFLQAYVLTSAAANAIFESSAGHVLVGI